MRIILNGKSIMPDPSILSLALYGYACFTSFGVENGLVKGFKYHLQRLTTDAEAIIGLKPRESEIRENILKFLDKHECNERIIVRVTIFPTGFSMSQPENIESLDILVTGRTAGPPSATSLRLATVITARTLPHQKTTNMIANLKARAIAREKGYDDALMINGDQVTEGATWNIFFQRNDMLITPELITGVLPGVTRRLIMDACRENGVSVVEEPISTKDIEKFECCFASNSAMGIAPIKAIDGLEFSKNAAMPRKIASLYASIPGERI